MPDLTPEQDRAVRDLLASAAHDQTVPVEIAARLDATLAGLVEDRRATEGDTSQPPVEDLAERRSRRRTRQRMAGALVAAAAAVVAVAAISQTVPSPIGDSADSGVSGAQADEEAGDGAATTRDLETPAAEGRAGAAGERAPRGNALTRDREGVTSPYDTRPEALADAPAPTSRAGLPVVRDATFASDSRAARQRAGELSDSGSRFDLSFPDCEADTGAGEQVLVRHRGDLALLVFRDAAGAVQRVDLYRCGTSEPRRTALIAAP